MLQAHYRSTLDLTDTALLAADKGFKRLMESYENLQGLKAPEQTVDTTLKSELIKGLQTAYEEMDDDFNAPKALARLFELASKINSLKDGHISISEVDAETISILNKGFKEFIEDIFGLHAEGGGSEDQETLDGVMQLIIDLRQSAREGKDWATSDKIRDTLAALNLQLKDGKEGTSWSKN